jgi:hypothetical protein
MLTSSAAAPWTTIRLAIEPMMVKLPAKVEAIATVNHAVRWSGNRGDKRFEQ